MEKEHFPLHIPLQTNGEKKGRIRMPNDACSNFECVLGTQGFKIRIFPGITTIEAEIKTSNIENPFAPAPTGKQFLLLFFSDRLLFV
jgi:hypothetical protein